eukprot:11448175-Prorocentrum_lima.AAC.1
MTSSLVGSEMCIRDRNQMITDTHVANGQVPAEHQWRTSRSGQTLRTFACLLYTSDAADDM